MRMMALTMAFVGETVPKERIGSADFGVVTGSYFSLLGIPLIRGRVFDALGVEADVYWITYAGLDPAQSSCCPARRWMRSRVEPPAWPPGSACRRSPACTRR